MRTRRSPDNFASWIVSSFIEAQAFHTRPIQRYHLATGLGVTLTLHLLPYAYVSRNLL
jgi:hypothetical protein